MFRGLLVCGKQILSPMCYALGWIISGLISAYLVLHLFQLIDRYAVNILWWDNFTYYFLLAGRGNLWERFDFQLGPHREGLGMLISSAIAPLTCWNMRAEAFAIGIIVTLAAILCLWLKKRLFGRIEWYDLIVIPGIFLTPRQYEIWSNTINSSHGALPLLLVVVWCLCWTIERGKFRDVAVLTTNFFAVFTGFGFFLGLITPGIYALQRRKLAVGVCVGTLVLFFFNYKRVVTDSGFRPFDPASLKFPYSIAVALSNMANISAKPWEQIVGALLVIMVIVAFGTQLRGFVAMKPANLIIVSLISFSSLFAVFAIEGRISSFGLICLTPSRYVPLIIPAFIGAYFAVSKIQNKAVKTLFVLVALNVAVNMSLNTNWDDLNMMFQFQADKERWIATYKATGDLDKADHVGFLPIFPPPRPKDFREKLDYLRYHELNFYARN
jgi:hypothetical protein